MKTHQETHKLRRPLFTEEEYDTIIMLACKYCPATKEQIANVINHFEQAKSSQIVHEAILQGVIKITGYDAENQPLLSKE